MGWFSKWKHRLFPAAPPPESLESDDVHHVDYNPAHGGETPDALHRGRRRLKETFTNHWDLDYLPRDELEAVLEKQKKSER